MKTLPLYNKNLMTGIVLLDDNDYDFISQWKWHKNHAGYAVRTQHKAGDNRSVAYYRMHRVILKLDSTDNRIVDHINRNKLDNRRSNLRLLSSMKESGQNLSSHKNSSSKYRGVSYDKFRNKWRSFVTIENRLYILGRYNTEIEAARVSSHFRETYMPFYNRDLGVDQMPDTWCDKGEHMYWRDPQRGRPPLNCHLHRDQTLKPVVKFSSSNKITKLTATDIVPGLKDILDQDNLVTLYCQQGQHEWKSQRKRGRKPSSCPQHAHRAAQRVSNSPRARSTPEQLEKIRESLEQAVAAQAQRVNSAEIVNNEAYEKYLNNKSDNNKFNEWIKYNSRLLSEVIALRSRETQLTQI